MTITATALRELHRLHKQITDLRSRLDLGPKQVAGGEATVRSMEMETAQFKEVHQKARVACDDKQVQLKGREDKIKDLKAKLNLASSNKEFQALKDQIAADEQANLVLEDEILEALEKIDQLDEQIKAAQAQLAKAQAEVSKVKQRVDGEHANLESELARVQGELKQAEAILPADFRANYDRISKARGEDTLAEVEGEVCGGCFQMLTPNMMNELYLSKPVFCKSCGALLYLPEGRGVGK
jgi:hypothetical protein